MERNPALIWANFPQYNAIINNRYAKDVAVCPPMRTIG